MSSCSCVVRLIALTIYYRKARVDRLASCKLLRARSLFGQTALVMSEIISNGVSICRRFWSFLIIQTSPPNSLRVRRRHQSVLHCCCYFHNDVGKRKPIFAARRTRCSSVTIRCSVERMNRWNWFWLVLHCGCQGHRISPKIRWLVGWSLTSLFSTNTAISQTKGKKTTIILN